MIVVLTGLVEEANLIDRSRYLVLCGDTHRDYLDNLVPQNCTGIISFGTAGALSPILHTGDLVIGSEVYHNDVFYPASKDLNPHSPVTQDHIGIVYSSPTEDTDTPFKRAKVFHDTRAIIADQESFAVAITARKRNLPFAVIRAVSDSFNQTVTNEPGLINPDSGSPDIEKAIEDFIANPGEIIAESEGFFKALNTLRNVRLP